MNLHQYPQAIADAAGTVNDLEFQLSRFKQMQQQVEGEVDATIAFDTDLKNDNQRKARRFETLQTHSKYQQLQADIDQLTKARADALARLEQLRGEFSIAKLELRCAIAQQLVGIETRELVGV